MPQILVVTDTQEETSAKVVYRERIALSDLESEHFSGQLVERVAGPSSTPMVSLSKVMTGEGPGQAGRRRAATGAPAESVEARAPHSGARSDTGKSRDITALIQAFLRRGDAARARRESDRAPM